MTINITFAIAISVVLMVILPVVLMIFIKKQRVLNALVKSLFIIYLCFLAIGVFGKIDIKNGNFILEFATTDKWFDFSKFHLYSFGTFNVLINLFMLFPVGALAYISFEEKKFLNATLLAFFISLFIESMQLILPIARSVELTDIVYNTLSGMIGYCFFALVLKATKKKTEI